MASEAGTGNLCCMRESRERGEDKSSVPRAEQQEKSTVLAPEFCDSNEGVQPGVKAEDQKGGRLLLPSQDQETILPSRYSLPLFSTHPPTR